MINENPAVLWNPFLYEDFVPGNSSRENPFRRYIGYYMPGWDGEVKLWLDVERERKVEKHYFS